MPDIYALEDLFQGLLASGERYHKFLRRDSLSAGIYRLASDQPDPQQPHTEDEVYYVLAGTGKVAIAGEVSTIAPGSVIFVGKEVVHRFSDYPDGLILLVIFAPPRGSGAA